MYTKNNWLARLGTGLNRFHNTGDTEHMILTPEPDSITQQGTPFSADRMNHMEQGIYDSYLHSGVNLLDNADWGYSLVNQRNYSFGVTNYNYCIDRWQGVGQFSVPSRVNYHIAMSSNDKVRQYLEIPSAVIKNRTCTFAYGGSAVYGTASITFPDTIGNEDTAVTSDGVLRVTVGLKSISTTIGSKLLSSVPYIEITALRTTDVARVWLELGETSHFEYTPPLNYSDNLKRCQRYYQRITPSSTSVDSMIGFGQYRSGTALNFLVNIPLPNAMREVPSVVTLPEHARIITEGNLQYSNSLRAGSLEITDKYIVNNNLTLVIHLNHTNPPADSCMCMLMLQPWNSEAIELEADIL